MRIKPFEMFSKIQFNCGWSSLEKQMIVRQVSADSFD